jgi:hypothetical protein
VNKRTRVVFATAFLLLPLLAADVGMAAPGKSKKGGNGNGNTRTGFDAELQPPPPADPTIPTPEGEAAYNQKINRNVDRQNFKARVEVPGIIDQATAETAVVEIRLQQGAVHYATCVFDFDSFGDGTAEYKLDVRYHSQPGGLPRYREHAGTCDVATTTPGVTIKAVPIVAEGDTGTVFFGTSQILTGVFD